MIKMILSGTVLRLKTHRTNGHAALLIQSPHEIGFGDHFVDAIFSISL